MFLYKENELNIANLFQSVTKKEGRPNPDDDKGTLLSELSKTFAGTIVEKEVLKKSLKFETKFKLLEVADILGNCLSEEERKTFDKIKSSYQPTTVTENPAKSEEEEKILLSELSVLFARTIVDKEILQNKKMTFKEKIQKLEETKTLGTGWSDEQRGQFENIKARNNLIKLELAGPEEEEKVYNNLRSALENIGIQDTIVISGWNITHPYPKEDCCDFDFLIVSEPLRTVFQIEVKLTHNPNNRKDAGKQLKKGLHISQSRIPLPKQEHWKYVQCIFFAFDNNGKVFNSHCNECQSVKEHQCKSQFCKDCQSYILGPETDLSVWWEQMSLKLSNHESQSSTTPLNTNIYTQIVQFLTRQMYIQGDCFTNQNLLDYTEEKIEKISTPEKLFFWSKTQFPLLHDSRKKRMIFTSHFGTGKTVLLRAKAKQLIEKGEKIVFIFFGSTDSYSLLRTTLQEEFGNSHQVKIMTWKCKGFDKFWFIEYFFKLGFTIFIVFSWLNLSNF